MARIGLITTDPAARGHEDGDIEPLRRALAERGEDCDILVWHEEQPWALYDALVLRSPWDYPARLPDFRGWLDRLEESGARLLNPPPLVRWNLDKRYLEDLRGITVIPTVYCDELSGAAEELAARGSAAVVLKPTVSGGSRSTGLFQADDPAALALAREILRGGTEIMIQPAIPELAAGAERGLFLIDGELSHAISKGAILQPGGGYLGGTYTEAIAPVEPSGAERECAAAALASVRALSREQGWGADAEESLYARIDVVSTPAGVLLIEAELIEPSLFLQEVPSAIGRVADAIQRRTRG